MRGRKPLRANFIISNEKGHGEWLRSKSDLHTTF